MQTLIQNNRRASAINELVGSLQMARSEAVGRNTLVRVCASSNGTSCASSAIDWASTGWIVIPDNNPATSAFDGGATPVRRISSEPKINLNSVGFPAFLDYNPNGRVVGIGTTINITNAHFTLCDSRHEKEARRILLDASGRPYACRNNRSTSPSEPNGRCYPISNGTCP
jgi:type IV fimbrial biogenesis protein FimT